MLKQLIKNIAFYRHLIAEGYRKIILGPLVEFLYIFLGSTAAIYLAWLIIWLNQQFDKAAQWPGLSFFFNNGSILLISFSFLASAAYVTTRSKKFTFFNIITFFAIAANALVYSAYLSNVSIIGSYTGKNTFLWWYSSIVFVTGAIWLILVLIIDQFKSVDLNEIRNYSQKTLEANFKPN